MRRRKIAPPSSLPLPLPSGSPESPPETPKPVPEPKARPEGSGEARRAILAEIPEQVPEEEDLEPECPIDRTPSIRQIIRKTRPLVSLRCDSGIWGDRPKAAQNIPKDIPGSIVRLYPPPDAIPGRIEEAVAECRGLGAVAVKVMPREPEDRVLGLDVEEDAPVLRRTVREVLRDLVAKATGEPTNVTALDLVVEEAIEVGEREAPPKVVPSQGEPIWIERIVLRNWFRYRGEHVLDLEPTVYGITATSEGDPERSNWQGKSSFLNAIAFALFGWLPEYVRGADDWITRSEDEGGVRIVVSDKSVIDRSRKRGKSTQLHMGIDGQVANQAEAQKQIVSLLGLSEEDFFATSFFPQKEIARLVKAKPGERLEIVRGWLYLDALGAAEEWARGKLADAIERERRKVGDLRTWEEQVSTKRKDAGIPEEVSDRSDTLKTIEENANGCLFSAQIAQRRAREAEQKIAGLDGWDRDEQVWRQAEGLRKMLSDLRKRREEIGASSEEAKRTLPALKQREAGTKAELTRAQDEARQKCQLAQGKFDGCCPVAGVQCPISGQINGDRQRNEKLRGEAELALARAGHVHREAKREVEEAERSLLTAENINRQIAEIAAKLEGMKGSIARIEKEGHPPDRVSLPDPRPIWREASDAEQKRRVLEEARSGITKAWAKIDEIKAERERLARDIQVLREAVQILGKGGAQKAIAVSELARVEALANDILRQNGIDLSVQVKWGRESSTQLSPTCEKCGRTGISGNGKSCPGCGVPRAPKISEKLDVELSDRSGAAEDLGGLALQIAASTWLRERRGARFGGVCIDEPFGALDPSHARSLSVHLAGILRGRSFKQGFVIAHTSSAMDALPGRIRVTGLADGSSKVEVEG